MFENEDLFEDEENDKNKINAMYKIRNKLMHDGSSIEEIKLSPDITFDPKEFVFKTYKSFIYRKFLRFLDIIDKYAEFRYGKLIFKDSNLEEQKTELELTKEGEKKSKLTLIAIKLGAENVNKNLPLEKVGILDDINNFLELFQDMTSEGTL